jgi:uncharacterized protein involved in exopolysaccharide biosynthesis
MMGIGRNPNSEMDESFDFVAAKDMVVLVLRSPRRHPKLATAVFAIVVLLSVLAALKMKPTYEARAAIIVQKNAMLPSFGDSAKNAPSNDFDPAMGVSEVVKGRDNLVSLARQTHLLERMRDAPDAPASSPEEKLSALVKTLERRLTVTSDGSLVSFAAEWNDPQTAYEIVSAALHNFLDSRTAAEVAIVSDSIGLLEEHAKTERDGIDVAMEEFLRLKDGWKSPSSSTAAAHVAGAPRPHAGVDATSAGHRADIAKRLDETKQQIKEAQDDRRRQLGELKSQLAGALATFTPSHPTAIGLQRKIEALSDEPANLTALKNEERSMLNELGVMGGPKEGGGGSIASLLTSSASGKASPPASKQDLEIVDPESAMALSKLQSRIRKYEDFMDQISAAKLQLDLAKNAFKYRYGIYKPAEVPTKPKYPIGTFLVVGGTVLAAIVAALIAALVDILSGRFVEPWQVRRRLSLPMLGEVLRP